MQITDNATSKVSEMITGDESLRVYISGGGCSGFNYGFKLDEKIAKSTKEGLWAGEFEDPEKWRRKKSANEKNNQIKG